MAISYPITLPDAGFRAIEWTPKTNVKVAVSPYTGAQQVQAWPAQWWEAKVTLPPYRTGAYIESWVSALLSLQGKLGTFYLGDSNLLTTQGTASGAIVVGSGAVSGSTTLPLSGGTGSFAVGDWISVSNKLHKVLQVNVGSVDVFPTLRSAYAATTPVIFTGAKGIFRLAADYKWSVDEARRYGLEFQAMEVLP